MDLARIAELLGSKTEGDPAFQDTEESQFFVHLLRMDDVDNRAAAVRQPADPAEQPEASDEQVQEITEAAIALTSAGDDTVVEPAATDSANVAPEAEPSQALFSEGPDAIAASVDVQAGPDAEPAASEVATGNDARPAEMFRDAGLEVQPSEAVGDAGPDPQAADLFREDGVDAEAAMPVADNGPEPEPVLQEQESSVDAQAPEVFREEGPDASAATVVSDAGPDAEPAAAQVDAGPEQNAPEVFREEGQEAQPSMQQADPGQDASAVAPQTEQGPDAQPPEIFQQTGPDAEAARTAPPDEFLEISTPSPRGETTLVVPETLMEAGFMNVLRLFDTTVRMPDIQIGETPPVVPVEGVNPADVRSSTEGAEMMLTGLSRDMLRLERRR